MCSRYNSYCTYVTDLPNKIITCRQPPQSQVPAYEIVDVGDGVSSGGEPLPLATIKESGSSQEEELAATPQDYLSPAISTVKPQGRKPKHVHVTTTRQGESGKNLKEGENTYQALQPATVDAASAYQSLACHVQSSKPDKVPPALPPKPGTKI